MRPAMATISKMACLLGVSGIDFDSAQSDNGVDYFYPEPVEGWQFYFAYFFEPLVIQVRTSEV